MKKDRIFVLVLALIVASLSYHLIRTIIATAEGAIPYTSYLWSITNIVAIIIAIVGSLWLIKLYRRGRRDKP